jgi:hypothetical protein
LLPKTQKSKSSKNPSRVSLGACEVKPSCEREFDQHPHGTGHVAIAVESVVNGANAAADGHVNATVGESVVANARILRDRIALVAVNEPLQNETAKMTPRAVPMRRRYP